MNIGGIPNYILTLSGALRSKGAECLVASSGGDLVPELERSGLRHVELDIKTKSELSPKVFKSVFNVARLIRSEGIDIVHAHTRVSQVVAFFACRLSGTPYVTTCHGYFKTRFRKIFDTWGETVIAISDPVREHLVKDLGVKKERVALVYSGIDASRFAGDHSRDEIRAIKKSYGLKDGPVVGHIGRLSSVKGQKFLVEAMKPVISNMPDAQLFIIGNGPEEKALKALSKSLGIEGSTVFLDSDLDTHRLLSVMDVFAFPSVKEGLGIALLEAFASGRACVASDIGGISDIIKNPLVGLLVRVGDTNGLSGAILKLLADEGLRSRMGMAARQVAKDRFSLDRWSIGVAKVYNGVLKKDGSIEKI
jgi:glycosyltransferase involved in cell wall biosynthesis